MWEILIPVGQNEPKNTCHRYLLESAHVKHLTCSNPIIIIIITIITHNHAKIGTKVIPVDMGWHVFLVYCKALLHGDKEPLSGSLERKLKKKKKTV